MPIVARLVGTSYELYRVEPSDRHFSKRNTEADYSCSWKKDGDWKQRYSKLYSCRNLSLPKSEDCHRISFMHDSSPYMNLQARLPSPDLDGASAVMSDTLTSTTVISARSEEYASSISQTRDDLGGKGTLLLDMVRARQRELAEDVLEKVLDLPKEDTDEEDSTTSDACVHGLNMRMTDRSISRSRISRMSTRRDMDLPSILAFSANVSTPVHLEIPAFQKVKAQQEEIPRWSIRRSVCPVCSQKWKDRSSIKNVKNSGLKRSPSQDLPSVIAPARLRTSITLAYVPRPALAAVDEEAGMSYGGLKNTSASWQLTRARRFRIPKPAQLPPEAALPPTSTAPLAGKDLDKRVSRFLRDETEPPHHILSN